VSTIVEDWPYSDSILVLYSFFFNVSEYKIFVCHFLEVFYDYEKMVLPLEYEVYPHFSWPSIFMIYFLPPIGTIFLQPQSFASNDDINMSMNLLLEKKKEYDSIQPFPKLKRVNNVFYNSYICFRVFLELG
jgi:hypothetical protein